MDDIIVPLLLFVDEDDDSSVVDALIPFVDIVRVARAHSCLSLNNRFSSTLPRSASTASDTNAFAHFALMNSKIVLFWLVCVM